MGFGPIKMQAMETYITQVYGLLRGEIVDFENRRLGADCPRVLLRALTQADKAVRPPDSAARSGRSSCASTSTKGGDRLAGEATQQL
jgi:hypothetical protein